MRSSTSFDYLEPKTLLATFARFSNFLAIEVGDFSLVGDFSSMGDFFMSLGAVEACFFEEIGETKDILL